MQASSLEFGEAESRGKEKREEKVQRLQGSGAIKKERGRGLSGGGQAEGVCVNISNVQSARPTELQGF